MQSDIEVLSILLISILAAGITYLITRKRK